MTSYTVGEFSIHCLAMDTLDAHHSIISIICKFSVHFKKFMSSRRRDACSLLATEDETHLLTSPFCYMLSVKLLLSADGAICFQGDGNIRYYEVVDQAPWVHYLNQFLSGCPQVGIS
jgi:hypothetical protein